MYARMTTIDWLMCACVCMYVCMRSCMHVMYMYGWPWGWVGHHHGCVYACSALYIHNTLLHTNECAYTYSVSACTKIPYVHMLHTYKFTTHYTNYTQYAACIIHITYILRHTYIIQTNIHAYMHTYIHT